jgi:hypothetical protein
MRPLTYLSTTLLTRHSASNRYLFAQERLVTPLKSRHHDVEEVSGQSTHGVEHATSLSGFPRSYVGTNPNLTFESRDLSGGQQRKSFDGGIEPMASLPISSVQRRRNSQTAPGLRLSDKRILPRAAIPAVADLLIRPNAISCFLSHCRLVYESWLPSFASNSLDDSYSINTRVIAALDRVQDLLDGNRICRLL